MISVAALLLIASTPFWAFLAHAVLERFRILKLTRQQTALLACGLATLVAVSATTLLESPERLTWSFFTFAFLTGGLLAHVYFHVFNMSETARRVKLLLRIESGNLADDQTYHPHELVRVRLDRLKQMEYLEKVGETWRARRSVLSTIAVVMRTFERLLFPQRSRN